MRVLQIWPALALTLLAAGCGARETIAPLHIVDRWLPEGTPVSSAQVHFFREREVARWDLSNEGEASLWRPERIDTDFTVTSTGLRIRSSSPDPSIVRACDLRAEEIQAIRLGHSGLTSGAWVQLYWSGPDEGFAEDRSVSARQRDPTGDLRPTYTFDTTKIPDWRGSIARLRIDPTSEASRRSEVNWISFLNRQPDASVMRASLARPWRVDLHGEVRNSILTAPGFPYERRVDVPLGGRLRVSLGLDPAISTPFRFSLSLDGDDVHLVEDAIQPCAGDEQCGWREVEIDLTPWAGRSVELKLETFPIGDWSPFDGFPAWGGLEVVAPLAAEPRPNLILVVVDTLRADRTSLYGSSRDTTPNLARWSAERGVLFDDVIAPAPWTLPSHVSLFTGLDALSHGTNTGDPVPSGLDLLAERLAREGYLTVAATGGGYLGPDYGLMAGFDRLSYWYEPKVDPTTIGEDLEHGTDKALGLIDSEPARPFFLFLHTYEVHTPYRPRQPFYDRFSERSDGTTVAPVHTLPVGPTKDNGYQSTARFVEFHDGEPVALDLPRDLHRVRDLYDSGVANADEMIGRVLRRLVETGIADSTVVIVTSDHGEALGEGGHAGHSTLQECEIRVPLIVSGPGLERHAGEHIRTQVRLIDIQPTVLDLLGLDPGSPVDGRSLVPLMSGRSADHPEDAISYASSSNFGVVLRRGGVERLSIVNTPWAPPESQTDYLRLDGHQPPDELSERVQYLRRRIERSYEDRLGAVRVRIRNTSSDAMRVILRGRLAEPLRLKTFDPPPSSVSWKSQQLDILVQPAYDGSLTLEGDPWGDLLVVGELSVAPAGKRAFHRTLRIEELTAPWSAKWRSPEGWRLQTTDDPEDSIASVVVEFTGPRVTVAATSDVDDATRDALRQLGYIQ